MRSKENRKRSVAKLFGTLGTILLILIILICIPLMVPRFFGYEAYHVISGSMEPEIPTGSLVFIKEMKAAEVEEEDVIAFYGGPSSSAIITHRVVENRVVMGEFITKGDANEANDMNPVDYNEFIGKVVWSIPFLGTLAQFLTAGIGKWIAIGVIGLILLFYSLVSVINKKQE